MLYERVKILNKKRIIAVSLVFLGLMGPQALAARTKMNVMMWRNDPKTAAFSKKLLDEYGEKNNIEINFIYTGYGGYYDKLLAMVSAGQIPDVIVMERRMLPRLAERKIVRPLDDMIAMDKFDPKKELSDTKSGVYDKKFYGFPVWGGPTMMYINPGMFNAVGAPTPMELLKQGKWNWDSLVEYGRKLTRDTNGDGVPDRFALQGVSTWMGDWVSLIWQNGGNVIDEDYRKPLITQPPAIEALKFWHNLKYKYNIAPQNTQPSGSFGVEKSAIRHGWLSESVVWRNSYIKYMDMQVVTLPSGKAGYAAVGGGCPVGISNSTRHPKEAYKLAKWFAMESKEWQNLGAPASRRIYEGEYIEFLSKHFKDMGYILKRSMENVAPEPVIHPRYGLMEQSFERNLGAVIDGRLAVEAGAEKVANDLKWIVSGK